MFRKTETGNSEEVTLADVTVSEYKMTLHELSACDYQRPLFLLERRDSRIQNKCFTMT